MKTPLLLTLILCHLTLFVFSQQQTMRIAIEDALGNRDTVQFGFSESSSLGVEPSLGEINIFGTPFNDPEIRVIQRDSANHNCLRETHSQFPAAPDMYYPQNIESKIDIRPFEGLWYHINNSFEFLIHASHYPIAVTAEFVDHDPGFSIGASLFVLDQNCDAYTNSGMDQFNPTVLTLPDSTFTTLVASFELTISTKNYQKTTPQWTLYPNPTTDLLYISGLNNQTGIIKVINIKGQEMHHQFFEITTNTPLSLNLNHLPSGWYLIQIFNQKEKTISSRKVMVP